MRFTNRNVRVVFQHDLLPVTHIKDLSFLAVTFIFLKEKRH